MFWAWLVDRMRPQLRWWGRRFPHAGMHAGVSIRAPGETSAMSAAAISLRATDDEGAVLAAIDHPSRSDYMVSVALLSDSVVVDLYPHYMDWIAQDGSDRYQQQEVCRTYVKFGECLQDKRRLHIEIQPMQCTS